MRVVDVNVLVYAHREELPRHAEFRAWLESAAVGSVGLGVTTPVTAGFVRIVTNHRMLARPSTTDEALAFLDALRAGPAVRLLEPGDRHWSIFADLCRRGERHGQSRSGCRAGGDRHGERRNAGHHGPRLRALSRAAMAAPARRVRFLAEGA